MLLAVTCPRSEAFRSVPAGSLMADLANASDINLPVQLGVGLHIADIFELLQGSCCGCRANTYLVMGVLFFLEAMLCSALLKLVVPDADHHHGSCL